MIVRSIIRIVFLAFLLGVTSSGQTPDDKAALKAQGEIAFAEADKLLDQGTPEAAKLAHEKFKIAIELFRRAGARPEHATAALFAGKSADDAGDIDVALTFYNEAISLFKGTDLHESVAAAHHNVGLIHFGRGQLDVARTNLEIAVDLVTQHKITSIEDLLCSTLGRLYDLIGEKVKAIEMFRRSVEAARLNDNRLLEAHGLNNLGKVQNELGARKSSLEFYDAALTIVRADKIPDLEHFLLNNIGTTWHYLGDNKKALEYYRQAKVLVDASPNKVALPLVLNNIGKSEDSLGNKELALELFRKALPLAETNKDLSLQAAIRNNIGIVYLSLQDLDRAQSEFDKALGLAKASGDKGREALMLLNIGGIQQKRGEYQPAILSFIAALKITDTTLDVKLGLTALNNIGGVYLEAGEDADARVFLERALPVAHENGDRELEALILNNLGRSYARNDDQKAIEYYNRSATLARTISDKNTESLALSNLMHAWDENQNRNVAIFFGKQAVNVFQSIRGNIKGLESSVQKTYLESVSDTYRKLVGLLIGAGRIAEAEQVLTMLKQEELIEFVRGADAISKDLLGSVSLSADERAAIERYAEMADKITAVGSEFGGLEIERKQFAAGEFPKQARYDELRTQLADASAAFEKFLEGLKIRYGQKDARVVMADAGLQKTLDRIKAHRTAAVATILDPKGIHIIVTTSKTQRAHFVPVDEETLGRMITEMRAVLKSPAFDPRPASQAVYDLLVKPIEGDLAGIKADTIVWSLDGALRYIPPAALWTKEKGYLAERFSNVVVSLASRETLALAASNGSDWSVLGVGVSKATDGFEPLFAVSEELGCIVSDTTAVNATNKCKAGVLPGRRLMDDNFTLARFEAEVGRYPVIHIASHFQLSPGDDKNSFLLMGGGSDRKLTVDRLRNQNLTDVDLIVLSACNTATPGGARSNGVEIEGFGSIAHEAGAKSVIATLWSVFDASTKDTMVAFYSEYGSGKISKAEALRRAQIKIMNGTYKPAEGSARRSSDIIEFEGDNERTPYKKDPKAPFAHPYYWSPFTLMGNWR